MVYFFLLSKARQAKTDHIKMKISKPNFGILVALTKNELSKICNEPGIRGELFASYQSSFYFLQMISYIRKREVINKWN